MIEKQALNIKFDERGKPTALLFRTKDGNWVWMGISELDEEEQISLLKKEQSI